MIALRGPPSSKSEELALSGKKLADPMITVAL
jgi:hypothetical protein